MSTDIHGHLASGFEPVAEAFKENFSERGELGAGFTLIRDGEILVDIHAGHSDRKGEQPWTAETIVPVFSTGKAITALVVAWLQSRAAAAGSTKCSSSLLGWRPWKARIGMPPTRCSGAGGV